MIRGTCCKAFFSAADQVAAKGSASPVFIEVHRSITHKSIHNTSTQNTMSVYTQREIDAIEPLSLRVIADAVRNYKTLEVAFASHDETATYVEPQTAVPFQISEIHQYALLRKPNGDMLFSLKTKSLEVYQYEFPITVKITPGLFWISAEPFL